MFIMFAEDTDYAITPKVVTLKTIYVQTVVCMHGGKGLNLSENENIYNESIRSYKT